MKKIMIIAAVLMFGMAASAQTVPGSPSKTVTPKKDEPVKTDVIETDERKIHPNPDGLRSEQPIPARAEQPADARAKANEHVKSSVDVQKQNDTVSASKQRKNRRP